MSQGYCPGALSSQPRTRGKRCQFGCDRRLHRKGRDRSLPCFSLSTIWQVKQRRGDLLAAGPRTLQSLFLVVVISTKTLPTAYRRFRCSGPPARTDVVSLGHFATGYGRSYFDISNGGMTATRKDSETYRYHFVCVLPTASKGKETSSRGETPRRSMRARRQSRSRAVRDDTLRSAEKKFIVRCCRRPSRTSALDITQSTLFPVTMSSTGRHTALHRHPLRVVICGIGTHEATFWVDKLSDMGPVRIGVLPTVEQSNSDRAYELGYVLDSDGQYWSRDSRATRVDGYGSGDALTVTLDLGAKTIAFRKNKDRSIALPPQEISSSAAPYYFVFEARFEGDAVTIAM